MEIVLLFVVFERQTNEECGWCSLFMLLNFSVREVFVGKTLVLGEIYFHIFLPLVYLMISSQKIVLYRIPLGINIPYWLTNHRSFRILLLLFDWSANQMR